MSVDHKKHIGDRRDHGRMRRYALWVVVLGSLLLAVPLVFVDDKSTFQQKLGAVGTSILASAVFAAFVTWLLNTEQDRIVQEQLHEEFVQQNMRLVDVFRTLHSRHVPRSEYAPTNEYKGNRFNEELMAALRSSSSYVFRGASAKYVSARIRAAGHQLTSVKVLILDPEADVAIAARAADRSFNPRYAGRSLQEIREVIKVETCRAIVAMHNRAGGVQIEIGLSANYPAVQRVEILDDDVFISVYNINPDLRTNWPVAYRYGRESLTYSINRLECARGYELSQKKIVLNRQTTDDQLIGIVRGMGIDDFDYAQLQVMRAEAIKFEDEFLAALA